MLTIAIRLPRNIYYERCGERYIQCSNNYIQTGDFVPYSSCNNVDLSGCFVNIPAKLSAESREGHLSDRCSAAVESFKIFARA